MGQGSNQGLKCGSAWDNILFVKVGNDTTGSHGWVLLSWRGAVGETGFEEGAFVHGGMVVGM